MVRSSTRKLLSATPPKILRLFETKNFRNPIGTKKFHSTYVAVASLSSALNLFILYVHVLFVNEIESSKILETCTRAWGA